MGKGGEKQGSNKTSSALTGGNIDDPVEVLIDGTYYDIKNMKHPGGSVIHFYAGKDIDATQAFNNFHIRSRKARYYLKSLPNLRPLRRLTPKLF